MAEQFAYRPYRLCDSCLAVDQDPRHNHGVGPDDQVTYTDAERATALEKVAAAGNKPEHLLALMRDLEDRGTQSKHMDCCLTDGCPDGTCGARKADPDDPFDGGKTTGAALVAKFEKRNEGV